MSFLLGLAIGSALVAGWHVLDQRRRRRKAGRWLLRRIDEALGEDPP